MNEILYDGIDLWPRVLYFRIFIIMKTVLITRNEKPLYGRRYLVMCHWHRNLTLHNTQYSIFGMSFGFFIPFSSFHVFSICDRLSSFNSKP